MIVEDTRKQVVAWVRQPGAIGVYYPMTFDDVTTKTEWWQKYGDKWELHHFANDTPKE
jgi:hypothetical protein